MKAFGFIMTEKDLRVVPKFGMTLDEVGFAFGSDDLVRALRSIGAIKPVQHHGQSLIFDCGAMAVVWARFVAGEYNRALEAEGEGRKSKRRVPQEDSRSSKKRPSP